MSQCVQRPTTIHGRTTEIYKGDRADHRLYLLRGADGVCSTEVLGQAVGQLTRSINLQLFMMLRFTNLHELCISLFHFTLVSSLYHV